MGILDVFKRNSELEFLFDVELFRETQEKAHLKRLALETCINMIGKTISQSEFQIRQGGRSMRGELYYKLNVRPNKNMSAAFFWQTVIHKLVYDNECLIVKTDDDDLLVADSFQRNRFTLYDDTFSFVQVGGFEFRRVFPMSEVIYLEYSNDNVTDIINDLFGDYGELFGRLLDFQKRKGQVRSFVDIEAIAGTDEQKRKKLQAYIDKIYKSVSTNTHTVIPQQKGFTYHEMQSTYQASVDELSKVSNAFLDHVAKALGIPVALLHGEMADVDKQTKNYMVFCINPLLKKIGDELNAKLFKRAEYLTGNRIAIKATSYESIFDIANSADKLISSGAFTGNEVREELGFDRSDDPLLDKHFITKNYQTLDAADESLEGGENE